MNTSEILIDAFGRIKELVHGAADGLDADALAFRPEADANSIAWLVWHLTRVQDDHVSAIAKRDQDWNLWAERLGMEPDLANLGMGHTSSEVGAIRPDGPDQLILYHDSVHGHTVEYLTTLDSDELDRVVDTRWDPPVTAGVRIVSVISDNLQHAGQALYIHGIVDRNRSRSANNA